VTQAKLKKYILYGSYASYYTAKSRAYLRKKGIPFEERLPSDPQFRERVRPTSGTPKIPQLLTPDGEVIQDTVEIVDYLETRHPELPAFPPTPRQRVFAHLMELLGSEGLVKLAWLHRWLHEDNYYFVKMDFGRSFAPQGNDQELMKYGQVIADRMTTAGVLPEPTADFLETIHQQCLTLFALLEQHFMRYPYLLGGQPCVADYAMMGALHAHLGRDPVPLRIMQDHAPRVFRWVEHMQVPEILSPEFFDTDAAYLPADEVPDTAVAILNHIAETHGEPFLRQAVAYSQWAQREAPVSGQGFDESSFDQFLKVENVGLGEQRDVTVELHAIWVLQRSQGYFQELEEDTRGAVLEMLGEGIAARLIQVPVTARLQRSNYRLTIG
jgi:glutathione S-transferase